MDRQLTGEEERFHGCRWGNLKGETESEIKAAQIRQTYALDRAITGTGTSMELLPFRIDLNYI